MVSLGLLVYMIAKSPYFNGFYQTNDGPVFNKGGLVWAALTLALLTVPVVIVATEEALAAVPNSMRGAHAPPGVGHFGLLEPSLQFVANRRDRTRAACVM